jgi:BlaI family penicillinase repressor
LSKSNKNLSPLEWEIMNIIWKAKEKVSVRKVLESAYPNGEKAYTTVQTVMNNLESKGLLNIEKIGMVNFYEPKQHKLELRKKEISNFVNKVFDGSFKALINQLVDSDSLTQDEVVELKKIIQQKEKELKGKIND